MANVQKDACFGLSLTLCTIFKICSQFLKIANFEKIVKIPFLQKCQLFGCFSVWYTYLFTSHKELVKNLVNNSNFLRKKNAFLCFLRKKKTKHLVVHTHTMNLLEIWLTIKISRKKCVFTFFAPKTKHYKMTSLNIR